MSLSLKAIGVLAGVVVTAVAAVAETIPPPESVWPQSVATWVALVLGILGVVGSAMNAHRAGVARALSEERVSAKLVAVEVEFTNYRTSVDTMLHGFSDRIDRTDALARRAAGRSSRLLRMMVVSQEDRKHLREGLDEIRRTLKELRDRQDPPSRHS